MFCMKTTSEKAKTWHLVGNFSFSEITKCKVAKKETPTTLHLVISKTIKPEAYLAQKKLVVNYILLYFIY